MLVVVLVVAGGTGVQARLRWRWVARRLPEGCQGLATSLLPRRRSRPSPWPSGSWPSRVVVVAKELLGVEVEAMVMVKMKAMVEVEVMVEVTAAAMAAAATARSWVARRLPSWRSDLVPSRSRRRRRRLPSRRSVRSRARGGGRIRRRHRRRIAAPAPESSPIQRSSSACWADSRSEVALFGRHLQRKSRDRIRRHRGCRGFGSGRVPRPCGLSGCCPSFSFWCGG